MTIYVSRPGQADRQLHTARATRRWSEGKSTTLLQRGEHKLDVRRRVDWMLLVYHVSIDETEAKTTTAVSFHRRPQTIALQCTAWSCNPQKLPHV